MTDDKTFRELQRTLPWGAPGHGYNAAYNARAEPHRDFAHALLTHVPIALFDDKQRANEAL